MTSHRPATAALLIASLLLPACGGGGPPIVTAPNARVVRWELEIHTPKANDPEKFEKHDGVLVLDRDARELRTEADTIPLDSIEEATYSFAKKPRWALALLAWPLLFLKKKQHWLAISAEGGSTWVFKMHSRNYSDILTSLEREGVEVSRFTEE